LGVIALCLWWVSAAPASEPEQNESGAARAETSAAEEVPPGTGTETEPDAPEEGADLAESGPDELPVYIPPSRGAALARVGAATRGSRTDLGDLQALAPDHVGMTTRAQPRLYWYLGEPSATRLDVTLIDDASAEPLVEVMLQPPVAAGLHVLDCAQHGVTLEPGVTYQWFVAFVPEPGRRSHDVISSGAIRRVDRPKLAAANAVRLAHEGLWYDAVMEVQGSADERQAMAALRGLTRQVGLNLSSLR